MIQVHAGATVVTQRQVLASHWPLVQVPLQLWNSSSFLPQLSYQYEAPAEHFFEAWEVHWTQALPLQPLGQVSFSDPTLLQLSTQYRFPP